MYESYAMLRYIMKRSIPIGLCGSTACRADLAKQTQLFHCAVPGSNMYVPKAPRTQIPQVSIIDNSLSLASINIPH